jgi:adenosylcobinamide kinase / adenosylcobinamide-phosphate guanylyltransferase
MVKRAMAPHFQLILGGARSGKSRFALAQGDEPSFTPLSFLATASAVDGEMEKRIEHHKRTRPAVWHTVEEPYCLAQALEREAAHEGGLVVVDCATLWISNLLCGMGGKKLSPLESEKEIEFFLRTLSRLKGNIRIVSNEVGLSLVPDNPLGRDFRDLQGLFNQGAAALADQVYFLVAGIPQKIK